MNKSRKEMEGLIYFSIVNLMLDVYYLKYYKNLMNLVNCQNQPECHQHTLNVKIIFIKPIRFVKTHEDIRKDRS